ncbi:AraC family transcriptional regulator [Leptolyngbya ohadii]|uniref:AraC family transcriptional regulator n=1 Tax=Leptolyngbya ohadii TaxID=1962290 RepID=UPI000B59E9D0|nr:AraC family transcriptional regulator [Leptolyngbya ohadii]
MAHLQKTVRKTARKTAQETVKFWRDPALDNLEMLRANYVTHAFSRHTHEGYAIGVIERGVEEFNYQGATHQAPAGSVVVIHPGEVHTGHAGEPEGWAYRMLYPEVSLMQKAAAEFAGQFPEVPYFPNPVIDDPQLAAQLRQLHLAIEQSSSVLERESRFLWVFAQMIVRHADICPRFTAIGNEAQIVRQVQDYLKVNYMNSITLEELAQLVSLKPLRLLRLFRKHVGLPPHVYLVQTRVISAKVLLQSGMPLTQVAIDTGFTDQSHLNRHFKRLTGVTPKQYAIGCKNVQDLRAADS